MELSRVVLAVAAAQFLAFGLLGLAAPARVLELVHLAPRDATSWNEARAMFGAVQLALGAWLAMAAGDPVLRRAALRLVAMLFAGALVARLASMAVDGRPSATFLGIAAFEAMFLAVTVLALRRDAEAPAGRDGRR